MNEPYSPGPRFRRGSPYGRREDPITGAQGQFHSGQDFPAAEGTPIPAAMGGTVVYSGFNDNLGNTVVVRNDDGQYGLYAHMKNGAPRAQVGQLLWPGDVIGQVGSTGARTTGPHLHYSVINKNVKVSPANPAGGPLGFLLNKNNTMDPAQYDVAPDVVAPYVGQTLGAERAMFGSGNPDTGTSFRDRWNAIAPAPPSAPLSGLPQADDGSTFGDRFGDWQSSSPDGAVFSPAPEPRPGGLPGMIADYLRQGEPEQDGDTRYLSSQRVRY